MRSGRGLSITVAVAGVAMTLAIYASMRAQQTRHIRQQIASEAHLVRSEIQSRMDARVLALVRLANRFNDESPPGYERFQSDSRLLYAHYPGFQAIEWLDDTGTIAWVHPVEGNEKAVGFRMMDDPVRAPVLLAAEEQGEPKAVPIVELAQGGTGFLVVVPIARGGASGRFIAGAFRIAPLFETLLPDDLATGYAIRIAADGTPIYVRETSDAVERDSSWAYDVTVQVADRTWEVRVWPSQRHIAAMRSGVPELTLAAGMLSSMLVGLALFMADRARGSELMVRRANSELLDEIARRRIAEEELRQTARRLEQSNRELQDFASVASHDLQEPLRKIQAFGDRLRQKRAQELGDDGRDYLSRMQAAAGRMQSLINDLLRFSRVTTMAQPFGPVDLDEVVRGVRSDLEARLESTGGTIEVGPLPVIRADALQMRQLMQNLIGNALKFHRPGQPPHVRVWADVDDVNGAQPPAGPQAMVRLHVQDNGIGFDEKYLDRIFSVFQRLHGRDQYEGTGIGLAVCRKIVERHQGSITARSAPGEGATFTVTLPADPGLAPVPGATADSMDNTPSPHDAAASGALRA